MMRFIASLSSGSQYAAAGLLALLGTRFAYFALGAMLAGGNADADSLDTAHESSTFEKVLDEARDATKARERKKADQLVGTKKSTPSKGKTQPSGRLVVTMSVSAGPPRSEVYANGKFLGKTPYLGSYTCRASQPIKIQILPIEGPVIELERICRGKMVMVSEDSTAPSELEEP